MKNLAKKLIEVMNECSYVAKNGENGYQHYTYATCADVLDKVNTSLVKHGICSVAIPELISMVDVTTSKGNTEKMATVKMDILLTDMDSGETASITGLGSGQDAGDKAIMKAQTAAIKYAYMLSFAISTGDDPEADSKTDEHTMVEPVKAKPKESKPATTKKKFNHSTNVLVCDECGAVITEKVRQFSESIYGRPLCMKCQRKEQGIA